MMFAIKIVYHTHFFCPFLISGTTSYTDFTEGSTVNAGDYVQLYIQSSSSSYIASNSYFYLGISNVNDVLQIM